MTPDPHIIGIGAVVSGRAEYDAAQARVERLKAEAEADRWQWNPLKDLFVCVLAMAAFGVGGYILHLSGALTQTTPTPTAPAAAIPCPGPGLNEHTYIVLANTDGQIRLQSCTTVHILGR